MRLRIYILVVAIFDFNCFALTRYKADALLKAYPKLACKHTICRNDSTCLNLGKLAKLPYRAEHCFCSKDYFGPRCEFLVEKNNHYINTIKNNNSTSSKVQ